MTTRGFSGVLGGAYPRFSDLRNTLIHVVDRDESNVVVRVLCGRVALDSMSDDMMAPGVAGPATCKRCIAVAKREALTKGGGKCASTTEAFTFAASTSWAPADRTPSTLSAARRLTSWKPGRPSAGFLSGVSVTAGSETPMPGWAADRPDWNMPRAAAAAVASKGNGEMAQPKPKGGDR